MTEQDNKKWVRRIVEKFFCNYGWLCNDKFLQVVRYAVSGAFGGLIQVFFLYVFVDVVGMWYIHGVIVAYGVALVVVFTLQKYWTFRDYSTNRVRRQSIIYTVISLCSLGLNVLLMYILVDILTLWHIGAQGIVVAVVGVASFVINKTFTFSRTHEDSKIGKVKEPSLV